MKSALLFPGLDAIFVSSKLKRWLDTPEVRDSLKETNQVISNITSQSEDVAQVICASSRPHMDDFDRTTVALTAIQVGIARALSKKTQWDIVVGCSHGDLARSVICEMISLSDAIEIAWTFSQVVKLCPPGKTANVRTTDGSPMSSSQIEWLNAEGASLSLWSTHHGTIAAEQSLIDRLSEVSRERGLKIKPVFPFAIHSPAMLPLAAQFEKLAHQWQVGSPRWPVFSSVFAKFIKEPDEIRSEAIAGTTSAISWIQTLDKLRNEQGVRRFINVGPSNALTGWMLESPSITGLQMDDAWELIQAPLRT